MAAATYLVDTGARLLRCSRSMSRETAVRMQINDVTE